MTTEEKNIKLKDLRECFKYICQKFNLTIEFFELYSSKKDSIKPTYKHLVKNQYVYKNLIPEHSLQAIVKRIPIEVIYPDNQINKVVDIPEFIVKYAFLNKGEKHIYVEYASSIDDFYNLLMGGESNIRSLHKTENDYEYEINKDNSKVDIMIKHLEELKEIFCNPYCIIITNFDYIDNGRVEIEYLSGPLPQFDSLSELKIKLDMNNDVTLAKTIFQPSKKSV